MSGTVLAGEIIRAYAFVFLSVVGSRFMLWLTDETGIGVWCVRFGVACLVATGLGYL